MKDSHSGVGPGTLRRIAAAWPRRATVRTDMDKVTDPGPYDPRLLDYPEHLLPFAEHPDYTAQPEDRRRHVNTLAWIAYNARVIAAEEHVANPTFIMLAHGRFPGVDRYEVKEVVQQSHVDEVWHTYMHMIAMQRTREARGITAEADIVQPVTNRRLFALADECGESWERDLLFLLWTTVGEVSINAFLDLLAKDSTIQPMHALVARLHARDEAAHGPVLAELMKEIFPRLDRRQQDFLVRRFPEAITAFGAEDYDLWPQVLELADVSDARDIVNDARGTGEPDLMLTDFSTVRRLLRDLEIEDRVEFDFEALRPADSRAAGDAVTAEHTGARS
ncbi:diiron oxygenase [Streptomyces canus]|uniref:diiron oxygenase n=1 Tax=Streptomyces canus TaxID=58343 RepID=UPI003244BE88